MPLIIRPGLGEPSVSNMIEMVRQNSRRRLNISIINEEGAAVDVSETLDVSGEGIGELDIDFTDLGGSTVYSENYWPLDAGTGTSSRRVKRSGIGSYYVNVGDAGNEAETDTTGTYLVNWHARTEADVEDIYRTQVVEIVSPRVLSLLPHLRLVIDKSWKIVIPEEGCYVGYADSQLLMYLVAGLHFINSFPPYPTFTNLDVFPLEYFGEILVSSALYIGLKSQLNFAIDTDIPSFSDQGHSFVLQHATPLASYLNHMYQDLSQRIKLFKLKYIANGSVGVEMRMDAAYAALLNTAPYGSLFRGLWSAY